MKEYIEERALAVAGYIIESTRPSDKLPVSLESANPLYIKISRNV